METLKTRGHSFKSKGQCLKEMCGAMFLYTEGGGLMECSARGGDGSILEAFQEAGNGG